MRRFGAAVMMAAALVPAGCGDDAPEPAPSSPAAPVTEATTATAGFVDAVRVRLPAVAVDRRDEEIQAVADQACAGLAGGTDAGRIVTDTRSLGTPDAAATDPATARELIRLAIDTTCPDQDRRAGEF
jgi:hypothetical protein